MNIYLLLSTIVVVVDCFTCPDGTSSNPCLGGNCPFSAVSHCYVDNNLDYCCNPKFCKDTGLEVYVPRGEKKNFKIDNPLRIEWTARTINGVDVSCPVPISALFAIDYNNEISLQESIKNLDDVEKYPYNKTGTQWKPDGTVTVDPCFSNRNCEHLSTPGETVGYCFNSRNPSLDGNRIDSTKFCYKLKEQKTYFYQFIPEEVGPASCKANMDCRDHVSLRLVYEEWYCHKTDIYFNPDGTKMEGICITNHACSDGSIAIRDSSKDNCDPSDENSCKYFGPATLPPSPIITVPGPVSLYVNPDYKATCTSIGRPDNYLCCQVRMCLMGKTKLPPTKCTKTTDCNDKPVDPSNFDSYKYWCDLEHQICCDPVNNTNLVYCPDNATPLRFEKECDGYIEKTQSTGTCTNDHLNQSATTSGLCKFGHCCPLLNFALRQTFVGRHSFATHHPCIDGKVPDRFKYAYCDPTTNNIVVIGGLSLNGAALKRDANISCTTNTDCSSGGVCVLEEESRKFCYNEASSVSKDSESETSWGTLALTCLLTILVTVCFFGACILVMWCCFIPSKSKEKIKEAAEPLKGACVCLGKKRKNKNKKSKEKAKKKEDAAEKQKMLPIDEKVKKVDEEKDKKSTSRGTTTEGSKEVSKEKKSEEKKETKKASVKEVAIAPKEIIIGDKAKKFLAEGPPLVPPPREQSKKTQSAKISRDKTVEVKEPNSVGSGKRNNIKECWFQGSGEDDTLEAVASLKIQFSEANTQESDKIAAKERKKKEPREELLLPEEPAQNQ